MNSEEQRLINEYQQKKNSFINITGIATDIMRLDGELVTLKEYFDRILYKPNGPLVIIDELTKLDEITFEIPEDGIFSTAFDDEEEDYSILYENQTGIITDYENVVGSFKRIEITNPLTPLGIEGTDLIHSFDSKRIELESRLDSQKIHLDQETIDQIKWHKENPETVTTYTFINIDPNYLEKIKRTYGNYQYSLQDYIRTRFNEDEREQFANFKPFQKNFDNAYLFLHNNIYPLKEFLNDHMDESRYSTEHQELANIEVPHRKQSIIKKITLEDNISTILDPKTDEVIGVVYFTDISNPCKNQLRAINFANNPQEELHIAQAKIYLNNSTKTHHEDKRYF